MSKISFCMLTHELASIKEFCNQYFDKIYVLTIPKAKDRQEEVKEELIGFDYEFFFGIDKKELNVNDPSIYDEQKAIQYSRHNYAMSSGQVACSLGHRKIYEDAVQNQYKRILIFEDDVRIRKENIVQLISFFQEIPENWEIVLLDYERNEKTTMYTKAKQLFYHFQKCYGGMKFSYKMINNIYPKPFGKYSLKAGYHYFANAYALQGNALKSLIQLNTPVVFPADHVIPWYICELQANAYIPKQKFFFQTSATNNYKNSMIFTQE